MKSLYLRIYLTVVAVLLLFALVVGLARRSATSSRSARATSRPRSERLAAWAELIAALAARRRRAADDAGGGAARLVAAPAPAARARRRRRPAHRRVRVVRAGARPTAPGARDSGRARRRPHAVGDAARPGGGCRARAARRPRRRRRRGRGRARRAAGRCAAAAAGRAASAWRSCWWCCSSPWRPAPTRSCAA